MKVWKKCGVLFLTVLLCIIVMAIPALAASDSQDGLEVTLTTDKEEYSKGEKIAATLTVTNTNNTAVSNVSLENLIPEGYKLSDGSEATKQVESLGAGETISLTVTYVAEKSDTNEEQPGAGDDNNGNTEKPDTGDNSGNTGNIGENKGNITTGGGTDKGKKSNVESGKKNNTAGSKDTTKKATEKTSLTPTTGDNTNIAAWVVLLLLAGSGIVVLILKKKKNGKKFLSLFLCLTMLGTISMGFSTSAEAAEVENKSISISKNILVDKNELEIKAIVKYDGDMKSEEEPTDAGEISFRKPSDDHIVSDEATGAYFVDNEILLTAREGTAREEIEKIVSEINGIIVGCIEITNDYQIEIPEAKTVSELNEIVEQLEANDAVDDVTIHYLDEMEFDAIPNDSKWASEEWSSDYPEGTNWGVEAINAMEAWEHYDEMSYVKVGIIDSMFDTNHEDLVYTKVWNNPDSISIGKPSSYSTPKGYADAYEKASHGTHVSGTMAACYNSGKGIAGVAPKVTLYGYSILGSSSDSVVTDSNKALMGFMEWKYALANLITSNCKVINVSMENRSDLDWQADVLGTFLNKLITKGYDFVIVQAAGNRSVDARKSGLFTGITIPAVKERIIIVGAIGNNGSHKNGLFGWFGDRVFDGYYYANFSNYGDRVDIVAPGVSIYSLVPNDKYENQFTFSINKKDYQVSWDGTSMAAPHVTGTAAMCFAVNPSLTGAQVKSIIKNSATTTVKDNNSIGAEKYPAHEELLTYRMVDAGAAVELALNTQGEVISPVNPSTGIVMGNVSGYDDDHRTVELRDVSVSAYRISDYDGNLSEYASATKSDSDGNYELILEDGQYYINIYKEGYLPFAICDVTVTNNQITYLDNVILWGDSGAEVSNYIHGTVRSALTGSAISDVTVRLRPGWDNKNGTLATVVETDADAVTVTDDNGQYSLEVLEGCYTAEFSKEGYITGYANVICTNMDNADQDGVITPVLSDDEYRIVLTWSSTPSDLDSHLSGPLSTGERFHVYYSDMSAFDNGETVATLDLDDTSSYGPETITLKKTQDGIYKYAVHDYSNRSNASSTELSMSGAKVKLYCGNTLLATYNVPINVAGNIWNVFEIEGDTVQTINTMGSKSNPSMIFSDDVSGVSETALDIDKEQFGENKAVVDSGADSDFKKELDISEE